MGAGSLGYFYVALTIAFTVYGQLALKWQMNLAGAAPELGADKFWFLARLLLNPWVLSAFASAFLASFSWMAAMTRLDLSHAYPFMSANFVIVLLLGAMMFDEPLTPLKLIGLGLIVAGIVVGSQG